MTYSREVTIAFGQCDPAGIVYYPNYFDMFNTSTEALVCTALNVHLQALTRIFEFAGIPMIDARNIYHRPSRPGDIIRIDSQVVQVGRSSFRVEHQMFTASGDLGVEGLEVRVWAMIDPENPAAFKGKVIPDAVRAKLLA